MSSAQPSWWNRELVKVRKEHPLPPGTLTTWDVYGEPPSPTSKKTPQARPSTWNWDLCFSDSARRSCRQCSAASSTSRSWRSATDCRSRCFFEDRHTPGYATILRKTVFWPELRLGSQYFVSSEAFRGCWPAYSQRPKLVDCWVVSEIPPFDPCPPHQNTGQLKTAEDSQVKSYHLRLPPKKDQRSGFEETVAISHLQVIVGLQNQNSVLGCLQRHTMAPMPQRSSFQACLAMPNPGSQCCCSRRERAKSKCEACRERRRAPISAWKICQGSGFEDHVGK